MKKLLERYGLGFILLLVISISVWILYLLISNKTFFKNTYVSVYNEDIYIPKYSYFMDECCMTAANFVSLKSKKSIQSEIDNYMKDFEYFEDEHTYGYKKGKLFIQKYEVEDKFFFRKIIIVY